MIFNSNTAYALSIRIVQGVSKRDDFDYEVLNWVVVRWCIKRGSYFKYLLICTGEAFFYIKLSLIIRITENNSNPDR